MSSTYLLPCHAGKAVEVTVANAGRTVVCPCGKQVVVPTLRELRKLPLAQEKPAAGKSTASNWTLQQGVFFSLGLLLVMSAAVAVIVLGYYRWQIDTARPEFPDEYLEFKDQQVKGYSADQTLLFWATFDQPLPPPSAASRRSTNITARRPANCISTWASPAWWRWRAWAYRPMASGPSRGRGNQSAGPRSGKLPACPLINESTHLHRPRS